MVQVYNQSFVIDLAQPFLKVDLAQPFLKVDLAQPFLKVDLDNKNLSSFVRLRFKLHSKQAK